MDLMSRELEVRDFLGKIFMRKIRARAGAEARPRIPTAHRRIAPASHSDSCIAAHSAT